MKRYFNERTFVGWCGIALSIFLFWLYIEFGIELFLFFGAIMVAIGLIWILVALPKKPSSK